VAVVFDATPAAPTAATAATTLNFDITLGAAANRAVMVGVSTNTNTLGMVADFAIVKKQLKEFLMTLDHVCLNDLPYFKEHNPTTENIAKYIYKNFSFPRAPLRIKKVQVWESDTASVVYYE